MTLSASISLPPGRLFGLATPLAVAIGLVLLVMMPNLLMHLGTDAGWNPVTVESAQTMR